MNVEKLIDALFAAEYRNSYDGKYHEIISPLHKETVEHIVSK